MTDETTEILKNTPEQIAAHKAQEEQAALEQTWPLFQVEIEGDDVPWEPRADTTYWEENPDPEKAGAIPWVPKSEGLPAHARVEEIDVIYGDGSKEKSLPMIVMTARATVTCRAKTKEMAKMMALRDNPTYHTVNSVKEIEG
jgi:hypothetical protein